MSRVINLTHLGSDLRIPAIPQRRVPPPVVVSPVDDAAWNEHFASQAGLNQWRTGH